MRAKLQRFARIFLYGFLVSGVSRWYEQKLAPLASHAGCINTFGELSFKLFWHEPCAMRSG
jgi:hypothetical protein